MTRLFERQSFKCFYDQDSGHTFSDIEFRKCYFESCTISTVRVPHLRSTVRNIKLIGCEQRGCCLDAAIVEDVVVDGLKTNGLFQTWGAVFKHVALKGKVGQIMISPAVATGTATPSEQRAFDEANSIYYSMVDWALDISEAEFEEADIRGVPARLVLRDPETQVVVTREKAMRGDWRGLDLSKGAWDTAIEFFLERGEPDVVLVAPKGHRQFRRMLAELKALRDAGIAEPD